MIVLAVVVALVALLAIVLVANAARLKPCLLYTSPSPRDA